MGGTRGQADPVYAVVSTIVAALIVLLGIYLFSELNQTITITGSLAGSGEDLLTDAADTLVLSVGGSGIVFSAILILWGAGR